MQIASLLAAEPAPVELTWSKTALVIIDMQRDFLEPAASARPWATTSRNWLAR